MNFLKKTFFGSSKQQPKLQKNIENQKQSKEDDMPIQILTQIFQKSAKYIGQTSIKISDEDKLIIYGLYKQATLGDCNTPKPSIVDFVGRSKWNSWNTNKGMIKNIAMKNYISKVVQIDPSIQKKMQAFLNGENPNTQNLQDKPIKKSGSSVPSGLGFKKVQKVDYSDNYSHPYFKIIEQGHVISKQQLNKQLLLQKNNSPGCYPLHFAIDKQRVDLVQQFLSFLKKQEIQEMKDSQGTGILEYAELIQNEEITRLVKQKLNII